MTLEIALNRPLLLPHFAQSGDDKPPPSGMKRKVHWVGDKEPPRPGHDQHQGGKKKDKEPKKREVRSSQGARGYRELSSITIGEVGDVQKYFRNQLLPSPYASWIATDQFCSMDLVRKRGRSSAMFGRVKTCYPSDGYVQNIQEMEIYFPNKDGAPDVVLLQAEDIIRDVHKPVQSYCVRAKFLASKEDIADFDRLESLFWERGFIPEFNTGYIDLLDMNEQNQAALPWLYIIGSRWFASIPDSVRAEVREGLGKLIRWKKLVFNYHPESLPNEIKSLNRELGYKHGFTDFALIEPETPHQTTQIVASSFEQTFMQPMK